MSGAGADLIPVSSLLGMGPIPRDRTAAGRWLQRHQVDILELPSNGGLTHFARVSTLPADVQIALAVGATSDPGDRDDAAWRRYLEASRAKRRRAGERADAGRIALALRREGMSWPAVLAAVRRELGDKAPCLRKLKDIWAVCERTDPANWRPALLDNHDGGGARAEISPAAWRYLESLVFENDKTLPLSLIHEAVAEYAHAEGQAWPSYATVRRRCLEQPHFEWIALREGKRGVQCLAERLKAEILARGVSQARAARAIDVSASVLSQFMSGTYPGDVQAVAEKATRWLDRLARDRSAAAALIAGDDFVATETAKEIRRSLEYVQSMGKPALTMIAGGPGIGKSLSLQEFARTNTNVWMMEANAAASRPFPFLEMVCGLFEIRARGEGIPALLSRLCDRLAGTQGMLIVDEAQHLHPQSLETARGLHELAGIDLVLAGDLRLRRIVGSMAQLDSRVRRPVIIEHPGRDDVRAFSAVFGVTGKDCVDRLFAVSQRRGALRDVESVLRYAGAGMPEGAPPDLPAIEWAIRELKLDGRRVA